MIYVDDTQVYAFLKQTEHTTLIPRLEQCIIDIKGWSTANDLKLNEDKTEVLHISSKFSETSPLPSVSIANVPIQPANSARNLSVIVTNDLSIDVYINNLCHSL